MEKKSDDERIASTSVNAERSAVRAELPDIRGGVHSDTGSYFDMSRTGD